MAYMGLSTFVDEAVENPSIQRAGTQNTPLSPASARPPEAFEGHSGVDNLLSLRASCR